MINRKPKKEFKLFEAIVLVSTNIALGPVGIVALGTDPQGEQNCSYDELSADSTAILDRDRSEHPRITLSALRTEGIEYLERFLETISAICTSDEVSPRLHT